MNPTDFLRQFSKMLNNLRPLMAKAQKFADERKYDSGRLLTCRLAPDQFDFTRQVQIACDTAKGFAARLSNKEMPKHEDNEKTIAELDQRIQKTVQYLETFKESDFTGWQNIKTTNPRREGKYLIGSAFAMEHAIPNFYFHCTTAYAILRNAGLEIGKKDFLGEVPWQNL
ncbi:DUF1993 domain-containing protein [bacterium]|nr:DUF1993 domain-containing protein [bacterium]